MTIKDKFRDLKEDKRYSIPAKRLKEHLMPILSKSEVLKKRWMWELLQNASDISDDIEAVDISVILPPLEKEGKSQDRLTKLQFFSQRVSFEFNAV